MLSTGNYRAFLFSYFKMLAETSAFAKFALNRCVELAKFTRVTYIGKNFLAKIRSQARPNIITMAVAGIAVAQ
jgi:hypothetical protein